MPLKKSTGNKAVGENIKKEEESGKSKKQAVAIGLNVQRKAEGKKEWKGGKRSTSDGYMTGKKC